VVRVGFNSWFFWGGKSGAAKEICLAPEVEGDPEILGQDKQESNRKESLIQFKNYDLKADLGQGFWLLLAQSDKKRKVDLNHFS